MKTLNFIGAMSASLIICLFTACQSDYLEAKPDRALLVPTTLSDFQALLDNNIQINKSTSLPLTGTDDITLTEAGYNNASNTNKNAYIWAENLYDGEIQGDWSYPYVQVFYSNIVLDGLEKLNEKDGLTYNAVKGAALFYRAFAFSQLVTSYSPAYKKSTADHEMGVPILLSSNINQKYDRGTSQQSYDQIISDLTTATSLLPVLAHNVYRPNRAASFALLARVYLCMGDYALSIKAADECIKLESRILDYNTLMLDPKSSVIPFPKLFPINLNTELLFNTGMAAFSFANSATTLINDEITNSYSANDLRKSAFIYDRGSGLYTFKGKYSGTTTPFSGLALDEVILTRAECYARLDKPNEALADLNMLLLKRYKTGTFIPYTVNNTVNVMKLVLAERRKELLFRGSRWMDLKRLNLEPDYATTITRVVNGKVYTLLPNSKRYVLPIPDEEIIVSGIAQNQR